MVPLAKTMVWSAAHALSKRLAARFAERAPERYTLSAAPAQRAGRLFIDYLRNGRGTTAIGAYSPRARPGQPIAAPISWSAVERGLRSDAFTMERLPPVRADPLAR